MEEAVLEAFNAGVALLWGPHEPSVLHLLRDVLEHMSVLQAALQGELDVVFAPDLQQGASLLVRPGHLSAQVGQEVAGRRLLVCKSEWTPHINEWRTDICNGNDCTNGFDYSTLHKSASLSISDCKLASKTALSTSAYKETSPSTGARRWKYRNTAGRPPLLQSRSQR